MPETEIAERLATVRTRIAEAGRAAGRDADAITLIAISKTFGADRILEAIAAGQRVFGENRVQEAQHKWPDLKSAHQDIELHLVGALQTNKVRDAVALFDVIHTLDRPKLAAKLAEAMTHARQAPRLMIQVNTGEEPQKAGIAPGDLIDFLALCRQSYRLDIEGLMCIPPIDEEPALHFALLAKLAEETGLSSLSMGMSADFETAVEFGASHVRIGTGVFGPRPPRD